MAEAYITCQELIKTLKISDQELIDIEEFFDSIPDDKWELIEGKDYRVVIKATGLREYTQSGGYTIARYLEATKKQNVWQRLKEWFLHTKKEIRRSFIRKKILDSSSSLIRRKDQFFISRADIIAIFSTRSSYLTKMLDYAKHTQFSLVEGKHYENIDKGGEYFSLQGVYQLAQAFNECLTKKNRKEWCKDVGEVIKPQIDDIVAQIQKREKRIQTVMNRVKKRDRQTCQVTRQRKTSINKLKLAAHHLYSADEYPYLADVENNLITLTSEVHDQFHHDCMSGSHKPCTINDFINFVQKYYSSNTQVIIWLEQQQLVLGNPQPVNKRKPHVLYLPASRVK